MSTLGYIRHDKNRSSIKLALHQLAKPWRGLRVQCVAAITNLPEPEANLLDQLKSRSERKLYARKMFVIFIQHVIIVICRIHV